MRRPITTFVRHNGIKGVIAVEKGIRAVSGGKLCNNIFDTQPKYVGSSVRILKETEDTTYIAKYGADGKISDGDFKILVTTDLHLWNDKELIEKALDMYVRQIEREKPDLVLLTGDVITTDFQQIDCIQFARMMEKMGVYWAMVFGNHEARAEKEYHKYFMLKNVTAYPHCLSKFGPKELFGYGNFVINIMNRDNTIRQSLFLLDSGRDVYPQYVKEHNAPEDIKGYDFLKNNQINWYKNHIKNLEAEYGKFNSMMFMHIPLCEYQEVMELDENENYVPTGKAEILYGGMYESVGCSKFNSGMFDAVLEMGSTKAIFAGHDHINDFCALYKGVYLIYAQCCGYNTYTMGSNCGWDEKDWIQGVTIVDLHADGSAEFSQRFNRDFLK